MGPKLQKWLYVNDMDAATALGNLSPAQATALSAYTGGSHALMERRYDPTRCHG
jgi:hypothetical protein